MGRRWASKPRRARARRRDMATSSEQAPAEEVRDGGAHLDRKLLFASCELNVEKHMCVSTQSINDLHAFYAGCQCVFHEDLLLFTRTIILTWAGRIGWRILSLRLQKKRK